MTPSCVIFWKKSQRFGQKTLVSKKRSWKTEQRKLQPHPGSISVVSLLTAGDMKLGKGWPAFESCLCSLIFIQSDAIWATLDLPCFSRAQGSSLPCIYVTAKFKILVLSRICFLSSLPAVVCFLCFCKQGEKGFKDLFIGLACMYSLVIPPCVYLAVSLINICFKLWM